MMEVKMSIIVEFRNFMVSLFCLCIQKGFFFFIQVLSKEVGDGHINISSYDNHPMLAIEWHHGSFSICRLLLECNSICTEKKKLVREEVLEISESHSYTFKILKSRIVKKQQLFRNLGVRHNFDFLVLELLG